MSERAQIALQVAIVGVVMVAAVYGIVTSGRAAAPAITSPSEGPDASLIASTLRSPTPSPTASARPTPTQAVVTLPPTAAPTASRRPPATSAYSYGGRRYTGVVIVRGWTITAPFDGRVEYHVYQLINGEIREGTDVAGVPLYPYFIVFAPDGRKLTFRPGALSSDTEPLVRASQVRTDDPLFRIIGEGPSSWHDFYDETVGAQIIVSLTNAADADLDAARLLTFR
jgi:hypothetical protein